MIVKLCMDFAASSPCNGPATRPVLRSGLMSGVALFILVSALDARARSKLQRRETQRDPAGS